MLQKSNIHSHIHTHIQKNQRLNLDKPAQVIKAAGPRLLSQESSLALALELNEMSLCFILTFYNYDEQVLVTSAKCKNILLKNVRLYITDESIFLLPEISIQLGN